MARARVFTALAGAALIAAWAGDASARQAGYVYLWCDFLPPRAEMGSVVLRIGSGQWDVLQEGAWWPYGGVACGAQSGGTTRTCTFAENYFHSSSVGTSVTVTDTINRMTGRYDRTFESPAGVRESAAQCRSIPEPATAQRQF